MPVKSYEKSMKSWMKFKDFEIHILFSRVDDPSIIIQRCEEYADMEGAI